MKLDRWAIFSIALAAFVVVWSRMAHARGVKLWDRSTSFFAMAEAIAIAEGFGVPGAIPTVRNNPGDLKLTGGIITTFPTAAAGWDALYKQLDLIRTGASNFYQPDMTLGQMAAIWTATQQQEWLNNVLQSLRRQGYAFNSDSSIGEVLS